MGRAADSVKLGLVALLGVTLLGGCSGESPDPITPTPGVEETAIVDPTPTETAGEATPTATGPGATDAPTPTSPTATAAPTDAPTPTQPGEPTPTEGDETTPTHGGEATPTQPDEATPTQPSGTPGGPTPTPGDPGTPTQPPGPTPTAPDATAPPPTPTAQAPTATPIPPTPTATPTAATDADGDGAFAAQDCDDQDADRFPGADEVCDGDDEDCDTLIDEGVTTTYYPDTDDDSWGAGTSTQACEAPDGYVGRAGDCDDTNNAINPDAEEVCNSVDDDCDGTVDLEASDADTWYPDGDDDGFGRDDQAVDRCAAPDGHIAQGGDCDDDDPEAYPGAPEVPLDGIDQDCDGEDATATDLNKDGYPDLVQANYYNGSTYALDSHVLYGGPDGLDTDNRVNLPTLGAHDACIADYDGDGWVDIAFANYYSGSTRQISSYLYWGSEAGFDRDERLELPTVGALDCVAADFDNDGRMDLVFVGYYDDASYNTNTYVYMNSEQGFTRGGRIDLPAHGGRAPTTADLNGDGYLDLIIVSHYNGSSYVTDSYIYWGSALGLNPVNRTPLPTVGAWTTPTVTDLDEDGNLDILFNGYYNGSTYQVNSYLYFGPDYSADNRLVIPGSGTSETAIIDIDQDGFNDIILAGYSDGDHITSSYVYYGSNRGWSDGNREVLTAHGAVDLAVDDIDDDGYEDVVFAHYNDGDYNTNSLIYWGGPTGISADNVDQLPSLGGWSIAIADIDQDGFRDVGISGYYDGDYVTQSRVHWGSIRGQQESARTPIATLGARQTVVEDLNGDGWEEVIFVNYYNGSTYSVDSEIFWGTESGAGTGASQALPTLGAVWACTADFNQDGFRDLVFANHYNGTSYATDSYVYWGSAEGYSPDRRLELPTLGTGRCEVGDLDGDGDEDLVFANYRSDSVYTVDSYVYINDGGTLPLNRRIGLPATGPWAVTLRDLNDDGVMEILFGNHYDGASYTAGSFLYWGDETGWSTSRRQTLASNGPLEPFPIDDIDDDGYLDIVIAGYYDGDDSVNSYIYWGSNEGYTEANRQDFPLNRSWSANIADFDKDGRKDVLFVTYYDGADNGDASVNHTVYYGTALGLTDSNRQALPGPRSLRAAVSDLNGDTYPDIAFGGYYDGDYAANSFIYWSSTLGFSQTRRTALAGQGVRHVATADLDHNGHLDVILASHHDGDYSTTSLIYWGADRGFSSSPFQGFDAFGSVELKVVGDIRR